MTCFKELRLRGRLTKVREKDESGHKEYRVEGIKGHLAQLQR